jgi:putative spermidine/putrescine transport system permease protein
MQLSRMTTDSSQSKPNSLFLNISSHLLLALLIIIPLLWIVGYSLLTSLRETESVDTYWTIRHWMSIIGRSSIRYSLLHSLIVSSTVTMIVLITTLAILLGNPTIRRSGVFLTAVCITLGTPSTVIALLVSLILGGGGLVSRVCNLFGIIDTPSSFPVLVNDSLGIGMIVALSVTLLPLPLLYFSQLWQTLHLDRILALSESLGANRFQSRLYIALPMLLRRGYSITFLIFLLCLGSYEIPYLLGRQSPEMISVAVQRRTGIYELATRPEAFVLATIYFLLCILLLLLFIHGRKTNAAE